MTFYNLTNISAANSTLEIMRAINYDLSNGWFFLLLIIAMFIIIFINMSFYSAKDALLGASMYTTIVSWLFHFSSAVPSYVPVVATVVLVIAVLAHFLT